MKLCLNSFWGKFGQQDNKSKTLFVNSYKEWLEIMAHDRYTVIDVDISSIEGIAIINYKETEEQFIPDNFTTNVIIAAFVTAYGRLELLRELEKLGERVIYHDTDSIIFIEKEGLYNPKIGNNLGDLTNEISEKEGSYITEIVCPGPKNYAYRTFNGTTKCVIKGFTLNFKSSLSLNFDVIKNMLINNEQEDVYVEHFSITRKNRELRSDIIRKKYGIKYDKRIIKNDGNWKTYPYGYKFK